MGTCISAPQNEAVLIFSIGSTRLAVGRTAFRFFCIENYDRLSLELYTIKVRSNEAETSKGVRINVVSTAQVKVKAYKYKNPPNIVKGDDDLETEVFGGPKELDRDSIMTAATNFLGKDDNTIKDTLQQTLEGHQRQILGTLTVEQIYKNKTALTGQVRKHVVGDLSKMGIELVSFEIVEIEDTVGYMEALGKEQIAVVKRQADEGAAKNEASAAIKISEERAKQTEEIEIRNTTAQLKVNLAKADEAESKRDLELKEAAFAREVACAKAEADSAHAIEMARQKQFIVKEEIKQDAVQEEVRFGISKQVVERTQMEKDGHALAEVMRQKNEAEAIKINAEAEAAKIREIGQARADVVKLEGQAEAEVILAKGEAEAKILSDKAAAFKNYGSAAITHEIVDQLPSIAREVAAPLSKTDKMTFISHDGNGGSALTQDVTKIMGQLPSAVHALTGFDMVKAASDLNHDKKGTAEI